MSDLAALLAAAGVSGAWRDADGHDRQVAPRSLLAILDALGLPGATDRQIADSLATIERREAAVRFVSADIGDIVTLPSGLAGAAELVLEDGGRRPIDAASGTFAAPSAPGYHRLEIADTVLDLAIAPPRCWPLPPGRHWGAAVQIAALRGKRPGDFGDFGTLAEAARAAAERGAAALAINPVHALFPADASRFSPYAPSSRLFLNALLGDPAAVGLDLAEAPSDVIDWTTAIPARLAAFHAAYVGLDTAGRADLATFRREGGAPLDRHALFDALHAHFFPATGWQDWPSAYHDPDGAAVSRFAQENAAKVDFYAFLQWRARDGIAQAQRAAIDGGMAIGLVADLAVGMDPGGKPRLEPPRRAAHRAVDRGAPRSARPRRPALGDHRARPRCAATNRVRRLQGDAPERHGACRRSADRPCARPRAALGDARSRPGR